MPADSVVMTKGDRAPALRVQLALDGGDGADPGPLVGAVGVTFRMVNRDTGNQLLSEAATIEDADLHIVAYSWSSTSTSEEGEFDATFIVDYGGGIHATFPSLEPLRVIVQA